MLKSYPEREELRAGVRRVVKETLSVDKLEDNAELRSDVERAMDANDNDDKDGEEAEEGELAKLKARLSRLKLEGVAKADVEAIEKGASDRDKVTRLAHSYVYIASQTLWRRLNDAHGEAETRASKDLSWRGSIATKAVDNIAMTSKGDEAQRAASQLDRAKARKVTNVQQIGKLITKLVEVNKLRVTCGVAKQPDEALVNIALSSCRGKLADVADEALDKARDLEAQLETAETRDEKKAMNGRLTAATTPRTLDDAQKLFDHALRR